MKHKDKKSKDFSHWKTRQARMKSDPAYKAHIDELQRKSLARRLADPEYKKRRLEKIKVLNRTRYQTDENYREFKKEQGRQYKLKKWKEKNAS